jgi:hypothetical protein
VTGEPTEATIIRGFKAIPVFRVEDTEGKPVVRSRLPTARPPRWRNGPGVGGAGDLWPDAGGLPGLVLPEGGSYRPMGNGPSPRSGSSSPRSRWSPWWSSPPSVAPASVFCEVDFSALDGPALQAFCALHPVAPRQGPRRLHLSPASTPPILFLVAPTYRFASCGQSGRVRVHGGQELHSMSGRSKTTLLYFPRGPQLNCEKCHSFLEECACCGQESRDGLCGCGGPICEGCTEAFCVEAWGMAEAVA